MTRKPRINVRIYYIERGLLDMSDSIDSNVDLKIRFGTVKSSMFEQGLVLKDNERRWIKRSAIQKSTLPSSPDDLQRRSCQSTAVDVL